MAKTWYPDIDYLKCVECGACISKCPHGVYDTAKAPLPVVKNPVLCIDHCHTCGNQCPSGAITYVGDDTSWMPPNGTQELEETCYSCGCCEPTDKEVLIEYLYLDLQTCDRCMGTDNVLDEVMMTLTPALQLAGYEVKCNKIEIKTAALAEQYKFLSSPTILMNGHDIFQTVAENSCGCCGEISGTDVNCRVFEYKGETYEVAPKEMVAEAILGAVFRHTEPVCSCGDYELPENLKTFFEGKARKSGCSCRGSCC